uniref:hypothetical protein n=1 Tax=Helicobacter salomonis TaxID=56878 RepID=UPI001F3FA338
EYYIFLQGGMGPDRNAAQGAPSSFANVLSVAGGKGGGNGLGQMGPVKAGWYNLNANQTYNIIVGSGGLCVVSYAERIN